MNRQIFLRACLFAILAGLIVALFHFTGNTASVSVYSKSAFRWMVDLWYYKDGFGGVSYTQGWLIPVVSLCLAWPKRREIAAAPKSISLRGLCVVVLALFLHWVGAKSQQTRLSLMALILLIWGIPFYLYGWPTARLLLFPIGFLIFCVPWNFFDSALFPLRIASVRVAVGILNGLGVASSSSGTAIHLPGDDGLIFEMAGPASSVRMVLAVVAFAAVLGHVTQSVTWKHVTLVAVSVPLALMAHTIRCLIVCLAAEFAGRGMGSKLFASGSSAITYAAAVALVLGADILIRRINPQNIRSWILHPIAPSSS